MSGKPRRSTLHFRANKALEYGGAALGLDCIAAGPIYSITSSARARSAGGTVRPSGLAAGGGGAEPHLSREPWPRPRPRS
jgi:hypothetical protein